MKGLAVSSKRKVTWIQWDMPKVWEGLFYFTWMYGKPPVQKCDSLWAFSVWACSQANVAMTAAFQLLAGADS
eukprot:m.168378 g.168378  ORF g.168378 m.168378 type:complete len:72 (+) comp38953_c1_seq29:121-336(+)